MKRFDQYLVENEKKEAINEEDIDIERSMQKKINKVSEMAQDAFWNVVKDQFKEYETKEIDSYVISDFDRMCLNVVKRFCQMNKQLENTGKQLRSY